MKGTFSMGTYGYNFQKNRFLGRWSSQRPPASVEANLFYLIKGNLLQLVESPHKSCNVFGQQLNPQQSKFCSERIFDHLVVPFSQNFINDLMTTDSQGRMDFIAHKISEEIKVKI